MFLNPLVDRPKRRMSDHVSPEMFARLTTAQQLDLAEPFVNQFNRLHAGQCDPGMSLSDFVKAGFIQEGLLVDYSATLPEKLITKLEKIQIADEYIASRK